MNIKSQLSKSALFLIVCVIVIVAASCSTKKYKHNRVNERVTPLESRTGELEETSRHNTQSVEELRRAVDEARGRADRAQAVADNAVADATTAQAATQNVMDRIHKYESSSSAMAEAQKLATEAKTQAEEAKQRADALQKQTSDLQQKIAKLESSQSNKSVQVKPKPTSTKEPYNDSSINPDHEQALMAKTQSAGEKLLEGSIQFEVPGEMKVGESTIIRASIPPRLQLQQELVQELGVVEISDVEKIKIARYMKVVLSADKEAFSIDPVGGDNDSMRNVNTSTSDPVVWEWTVKPLKSGSYKLNLVVSAFLSLDTKAVDFYRAFPRPTNVKASLAYSTAEALKASWQFLASSVAIPFVVFGWSRYTKKKEEMQQKNQQASRAFE